MIRRALTIQVPSPWQITPRGAGGELAQHTRKVFMQCSKSQASNSTESKCPLRVSVFHGAKTYLSDQKVNNRAVSQLFNTLAKSISIALIFMMG